MSGPTRTSRREVVPYRGDHLVLVRRDPDVGAHARLFFDLDGDGAFEREVRADATGLYTVCFDAAELRRTFTRAARSPDGEALGGPVEVEVVREEGPNPAAEVPVNCVPGDDPNLEPGICTCTPCPLDDTLEGASLDGFTHSFTPAEHGVELATGKVRTRLPVTSFETRRLGFTFGLHQASLVAYDGPWGLGVSHGFNMMVVRTDEGAGRVVTPDLRIFDIASDDGEAWTLPAGFNARLQLDAARERWTLTHFSGLEVEFFRAPDGRPGYPVSIRDPNGNATRLEYDGSGLLRRIVTDLEQVQTLAYDASGRLRTFVDHIGRCWRFGLDDRRRLTRIATPATEHADVAPGEEITGDDLPRVTVRRPRVTTLEYGDDRFPGHITAVIDPRGGKPGGRVHDEQGRVATALVNGRPVLFAYEVPDALEVLDEGNRVTRVTDREGNVVDHEIHGPGGGPIDGRGRLGLRRRVTWTERGKGNAPLRDDEPDYWEQRWLHDCDCLAPQVVVQPFASTDLPDLRFDEAGVPGSWPRRIYERNALRQVTSEVHTDGASSIRSESAYQPSAFGDDGQFSRRVAWVGPRAFDDHPVNAGLEVTHTWAYDERGNRTRYEAPRVTRGVEAPQRISESWTYNAFGQPLRHVDPNGNVTLHAYHDGPSTGGDINARGAFGGYLAATTRGGEGSADAPARVTDSWRVNALGMVTRWTDPRGFTFDAVYDDLQERTRWVEPPVTLHTGEQARFETRWVYDAAGYVVVERRSDVDLDGSVRGDGWVDRAWSYDAVGNALSLRVEVDDEEANDLIERYAYDGNDDRSVTRKPEGNRTFLLYDERRLPFKTFYGVGRGVLLDGYPDDKRAEALADTPFIGRVVETYDARANPVRTLDARGNATRRGFDVFDRQVAEADGNGNGWVREYDDASNVLTTERGVVDASAGVVTRLLERTYHRFDESGRPIQRVREVDLGTDRRNQVDPDDGRASSFRRRFDAGGRRVEALDANGNATRWAWDAADRMVESTDALGNRRAHAYDAASNLVRVEEVERPGPGADGEPETYITTFVHDALNRPTERHDRGRDGTIDHARLFAYDSRHNRRLRRDAEGVVTLSSFDDADRLVRRQRFDGGPGEPGTRELLRWSWRYDGNGRLVEERALADVTDPASEQVTRRAWDALDRPVRTAFPDSDAPVDRGDGRRSGAADLFEVRYDANSNVIHRSDPRGVLVTSRYDAGDRLTDQEITLPTGVPGPRRRTLEWDALDRLIDASNDHARVERAYDPLSRLVSETQWIRLDGAGFRSGWEEPIEVRRTYDRQSNRTRCEVRADGDSDLDVLTRFDPLNRPARVRARYLAEPVHDVVAWAYVGPSRVRTRALGNGAVLTRTYDARRRVTSHRWTGPDGLLAGFEYGYDRVGNARFERFLHDGGRYDRFRYDDLYQLTGVDYRARSSRSRAEPRDRFFYDDVLNRTQAAFAVAVGAGPSTFDCYRTNAANEYVGLRRNGQDADVAHDAAGNATRLLVRPGGAGGDDALARAHWDASNLLFEIDSDPAPGRRYRYDALRRRVATLELDGEALAPDSRRYVHDGWDVVEERVFEDRATLAAAPSRLERVYVNGPRLDQPLLVAIDRDGDGALPRGDACNARAGGGDREYYLLDNRLGSVMALLDARRPGRVLERYRYAAFGEASVLPGSARRGRTRRGARRRRARRPRGPLEGSGNTRLFAGLDLDHRTGLYHARNRVYDPLAGRFLSRDPLGSFQGPNHYAYAANRAPNATDPTGLLVGCVGLAGNVVPYIGVGVGLFYCHDECGNNAVVFAPSARAGLDLGAGAFILAFEGGLAQYLNTVTADFQGGVGPVTGGVQADATGDAVGGYAGLELSPLPVSGSAGFTFSYALYANLGRGYPCHRRATSPPPPEPVEFAEAPPGWRLGPVWRPTSTDLPGACCCVALDCEGEEGRPRATRTAILGVPPGTTAKDCDAVCQDRSYTIGYGAQQTGASQQCLPGATARSVERYRRGLPHHRP